MREFIHHTSSLHPVEMNSGLGQNLLERAQASAVPSLCCLGSHSKHTREQLAAKEGSKDVLKGDMLGNESSLGKGVNIQSFAGTEKS